MQRLVKVCIYLAFPTPVSTIEIARFFTPCEKIILVAISRAQPLFFVGFFADLPLWKIDSGAKIALNFEPVFPDKQWALMAVAFRCRNSGL